MDSAARSGGEGRRGRSSAPPAGRTRAGFALILLVAPACQGTFRFDERDGGGRASPPGSHVDHGGDDLSAEAGQPTALPRAADGAPDVASAGPAPSDAPDALATSDLETIAQPTDAQPPGPAVCSDSDLICSCVSDECSCQAGQACWFSGAGCDLLGGRCGLSCLDSSHCEGSCLHSCMLTCTGGGTCRLAMHDDATVIADGAGTVAVVTVGRQSQVKCVHGATCHVTCLGTCALQCMTGAVCDLKCPSDDTAAMSRPANNGGACTDH
jgi:hypothetical protein